jgi:hypothetical protein
MGRIPALKQPSAFIFNESQLNVSAEARPYGDHYVLLGSDKFLLDFSKTDRLIKLRTT